MIGREEVIISLNLSQISVGTNSRSSGYATAGNPATRMSGSSSLPALPSTT